MISLLFRSLHCFTLQEHGQLHSQASPINCNTIVFILNAELLNCSILFLYRLFYLIFFDIIPRCYSCKLLEYFIEIYCTVKSCRKSNRRYAVDFTLYDFITSCIDPDFVQKSDICFTRVFFKVLTKCLGCHVANIRDHIQ